MSDFREDSAVHFPAASGCEKLSLTSATPDKGRRL